MRKGETRALHTENGESQGRDGNGGRLGRVASVKFVMRIGRTIRSQLTLIQMITCTIAVVACGISFGSIAHCRTRQAAVQNLIGLAEAIAHNSEAALAFNVEEDAQQMLQILHTRKSVSAAYIYDSKDAVFASFIPEGATPFPYSPPIEGSGHVFQNHHVRVYAPIVFKGEVLGSVCIEDNLASVRDAARRNIIALAFVMLGALLLALIAASRLQSIISKPILALAGTARHVTSDSDYSLRAPAGGSEEIRSLNEAFNEMLHVTQQRDIDLSNEVRVRRKAEEELRHHGDQLEAIVAERTAELERANEDLRREVQEHERAERLLRRTLSDLETTNSELERFAQVAAHDLQEPLRKMLAFGDRLASTANGGLDAHSQGYLNRITRAAKQMQFLIDDLLAFSRLARRKPIFRSVDMGSIVEQVLKELKPEIDAAEAKVTVSDLPTIEAEQPQMQQLFRHLISNAIKFRREDEQLAIDVSAITDGDTVTLYVKDNGMGFEQKYETRIFEIFQRLHARHIYEGTGIGLAICRRIADVHGGSITAKSQPGQGSTFAVRLPREQ